MSTTSDDQGQHQARACRSCSLSLVACRAKYTRTDEPCCPSCEHRVPLPELGSSSEEW